MNGRIHMKGMVFYGHHGDIAEERALGQRFIVDLTMVVDVAEVIRTDDLNSTVNYVDVYSICQHVLEKEPVKLIETVAARLGEKIFAAHPRVRSVEITVKKPSVPLRGVLDYVAAELTLTREDGVPRARQ